MEGLLKGSHPVGAFGLKALKLFLARQKFPVLALKYFGLGVKAALLSVREEVPRCWMYPGPSQVCR